MTKPLYFYNGSTFELVGPTTPQSPIAYQTSAPTAPATGDLWIDSDGDVDTYNRQLTRYYFVATASQTTVSGVDANGLTLAYVAGSEAVYVNGALQVRGQDYTATNGTSVVMSSGLAVNDVVEIFAYTAFTVANAYTKSETDALLVKPTFAVKISTGQSISNTTWTKVAFDTEIIDTASAYDTSTYRFTVPTGQGGNYLIGTDVHFGVYTAGHQIQIAFKINGSFVDGNRITYRSGSTDVDGSNYERILNMSAGDYLECFVYHNRGSAATLYSPYANFWGHKI